MKKKYKKIFSKIFAIFLIAIAIYLFSGVAQQVYTTLKLQEKQTIAEKELSSLKEENATLIKERSKLEDPNYIETYARGEYMFSKEGEEIFYLPDSSTSENSENSSK